MWADTYYVDPFMVSVNVSLALTTNPQVNQTEVDLVPSSSSLNQATQPTSSQGEPGTPAVEAKVSSHTKRKSNGHNALTLANKNPVTIQYVIFNHSDSSR